LKDDLFLPFPLLYSTLLYSTTEIRSTTAVDFFRERAYVL
jgi:hypothetical protein